MAKKKTRLPQRYVESKTEKAIFELVSKKGVSKTLCVKQFGLAPNYFAGYVGCQDNYDKAQALFVSEVLMKSVVDNLNFDSPGRKYMLQKLRVFDAEIELPIKKMTTAKHASENLSFALSAYAKKQIGDDALQQIRAACSVFSDLMVSTTLEEKIANLEKIMEEKFNGKNG